MAGGSITGRTALVKWSYYTAATLEGFHVVRDDEAGWAMRGAVVSRDDYLLTQRPLVFVIPHAKGAWYWPVVRLEVNQQEMSAVLGPPVE